MANTVSIVIDLDDVNAPKSVAGIPWYFGITILEAMVIGQAMDPSFSFRVVYDSVYGAFVDQIDGQADTPPKYWMVSVDGVSSQLGVSEAIILESGSGTNAEIEWVYVSPTPHPTATLQAKVAPAVITHRLI